MVATRLTVDALFAGPTRPMPATGKPTGMFKQPVGERVMIGLTGIVGDAVAETRIHGGPEKAVHQFPAEHYPRLSAAYPETPSPFVRGSVGENLSTLGADESGVCIGDVYAFGRARLQVSQPRSPCIKLEQRFGIEGLAGFFERQGCAGWYLRVLAPGTAQAGDDLELLERNPDPVSLAEFWRLKADHRPSLDWLERVIATPGLSPQLRPRLEQRRNWLRQHRR